jgi:hypothetical protein
MAQFGVPQKRDAAGGSGFEELNEKAAAAGMGGLDDLANLNQDDLMGLISEAMNDPAMAQYMESMGEGMADVMEQLSQMSPEQIAAQIEQNLASMASPEMLNSVLEQQDEVLDNLLAQGLITEEQKKEFEDDPQKFQETMSEAFGEMSKVLSDPEALDAMAQVMGGVSDMMKDPAGAMGDLAAAFASELGDDEKIEEARLQLLANPEIAGNPMLASLFEDEEMQDILKDPVKWREQVKKGQNMMLNDGAGIGEL